MQTGLVSTKHTCAECGESFTAVRMPSSYTNVAPAYCTRCRHHHIRKPKAAWWGAKQKPEAAK